TLSGVGFEAGVDAAAEFAAITGENPSQWAPSQWAPSQWAPSQWAPSQWAPSQWAPSQWALRWVIQQPGVTTVIPGARSTGQARQNAEAASLPPLPQAKLDAIEGLYGTYFRAKVHDRW